MGIFKFLGKLFKEEDKKEEIEVTKKEVSFSDLDEIIKEKDEEINQNEKRLVSIVKGRIEEFIIELQEKIKNAEKVNIEEKEKNDKVKSIVYEGRKKYVEFLERLINNLEESKNISDFNKQIESINSSFLRFGENSGKSYERATILIGKEMGVIKESLKKFSTEILTLFNENKEIITERKKINAIKSKKEENKQIEEQLLNENKEIKKFEEELKLNEKKKNELSEKINEIKKEKDYLENIRIQKDIEEKEEDIKKEVSELRQLIDFKSLSNFFHIFEEKMKIVKLYKDNFNSQFNEDKGKKLIILLNESKTNSEAITNKIEEILSKEKSIKEEKSKIKEDKTISISSEIISLNEKIETLKKEKEWAEKKRLEITEKEQKNTEDIKQKLNALNITLKS